MSKLAIAYGVVLIALGLGGYFASGRVSVTALIPAFFGIPILGCGALALREGIRKHAMHAAAALGTLALLGSGGRLPMVLAKGTAKPLAIGVLAAMAGLSLLFVALCVHSFVVARLRRRDRRSETT